VAYSLDQAVADLQRSVVFNTQKVTREPLDGLVDGANRLFHLSSPPALEGDVTLYDASGSPIPATDFTVDDYATGSITFATAPTGQVYASYTAVDLTRSQLLDVARAGFDHMQRVWPQGWYLVTDSGSQFISSSSTTVVDPTVQDRSGADVAFSTSRAHIDLYMLCCLRALAEARLIYSAAHHFAYRENRSGGMMVDRSRQATALQALLEHYDRQIQQALMQIVTQSELGSYIPGAKSDYYQAEFDWWTTSRQARGQ